MRKEALITICNLITTSSIDFLASTVFQYRELIDSLVQGFRMTLEPKLILNFLDAVEALCDLKTNGEGMAIQ